MWTRIDFTNVLGTELEEDVDMDGAMTKEEIVIRLAAALQTDGDCRANALKIVEKCVYITGNVNNALDSDDEDVDGHPAAADEQIVVYPLTKTDAFLARVLRAQGSRFTKKFSAENPPVPNAYQRRYIQHCGNLVMPNAAMGGERRVVVNRSVLRKLGEINVRTSRLDFGAHLLGALGVIPLCKALRGMATLQSISLAWNDVRDVSLEYVEELLETCPKLSFIDLGQNKFLAATAGRVLVRMAKRFPDQLKYLKTNGCSLPPHYTATLKQLLPNLGPIDSASEDSSTPRPSSHDTASLPHLDDDDADAAPPAADCDGANADAEITLADTDLGAYLDL
eukprot:TRINITY_DN11803_c0_g1_i1.p1 TRINITY_DN11803_c0_g1~~TRINITY_DN11803_c0_g1_i1.p1  ORF type:complete len:337 (+),score=106.30 TRINITY_DN11803_c0_g1_i1:80-1090(+)